MARWCIFLLIASIFIISLTQSVPIQEEAGSVNKIEDSIKKALETISKGFEDMIKDPKVNELIKDGQKMMEEAAEKIKTEASKLLPKTDGAAR
ncbi:hypothetical protein KQX54_015491 [Cotesia glomerata]|uniref:Uncharacterized protein n=1 Tax=Cotesia glomerata TaxID=32391 RepID=A0AAV7IDT2_COTGL|nr:hypothetical protein KQX54_015491 [Cotesia glomerata]